MKIGDRVKIVRSQWGHPSQDCFTGATGVITADEDPFPTRPNNRRYEVTFDAPVGPSKYENLFPLFTEELQYLNP